MLVSNSTPEMRHSAKRNGKATLLLVLLLSTFSYAQWSADAQSAIGSMASAKLSPDLAETLQQSAAPVKVIVQYKKAPTATQIMSAQAAQVAGAKPATSLSLIKSAAYTMSPAAIASLAQDPNVAHIWPDRPVQAMDDLTDAAIGMSTSAISDWPAGALALA